MGPALCYTLPYAYVSLALPLKQCERKGHRALPAAPRRAGRANEGELKGTRRAARSCAGALTPLAAQALPRLCTHRQRVSERDLQPPYPLRIATKSSQAWVCTCDPHPRSLNIIVLYPIPVSSLTPGGNVLVHCAMGISRSASTIIAYLMWKQRLGFAEAASQVGQGRERGV